MFQYQYQKQNWLSAFFKDCHLRSLVAVLVLSVFSFNTIANAAEPINIAVIYPASEGRVARLYQLIMRGMVFDSSVNLQQRELDDDDTAEDIQQWLNKMSSQVVILLGKQGRLFSDTLALDIPVISGAHSGIAQQHSMVSLASDPWQLFKQLKKLKPDIQRVSVIYNPDTSGWLIKKAQLAAKQLNIKLLVIQSDNIQASGIALKSIISQANLDQDALWLTSDPVLPVKLLLPELLKTAWNKNLILFSGNPYHVQQGALFAMYPDYSRLGVQLVELALLTINEHIPSVQEPSRYLNTAINTRTASHIGIQISRREIEGFKLVFPVR